MNKKVIFLVLGLLIIAALIYLFYPTKIECSSQADCLNAYFLKCRNYETTLLTDELFVRFNNSVKILAEVSGDKENGKCGISFLFQQISNPEDLWLQGKGTTCYFSENDLKYKDGIQLLKDSCTGDFAEEAISRCQIIASSNNSLGIVKNVWGNCE